jgi:hypothetical protein
VLFSYNYIMGGIGGKENPHIGKVCLVSLYVGKDYLLGCVKEGDSVVLKLNPHFLHLRYRVMYSPSSSVLTTFDLCPQYEHFMCFAPQKYH